MSDDSNQPQTLPYKLSTLPQGQWSVNQHTAYTTLQEGYVHTLRILRQSAETACIRHHAERIHEEFILIMEALEIDGFPQEWLYETIWTFSLLSFRLEEALAGLEHRCVVPYYCNQDGRADLVPEVQLMVVTLTV